jgi:hypothetical protein
MTRLVDCWQRWLAGHSSRQAAYLRHHGGAEQIPYRDIVRVVITG